jgi:hypothetical protein
MIDELRRYWQEYRPKKWSFEGQKLEAIRSPIEQVLGRGT